MIKRDFAKGGIPENARERLGNQASLRNERVFLFTINLTIRELALMHEAGYEALGQVMLSSAYHPAMQHPSTAKSKEFKLLSQEIHNVHLLALSRLQQEAAILHATDDVGVRLEYNDTHDKDSDHLGLIAIGTAVKPINAPPTNIAPRLNALSCVDFR